MKLPFSYKNQHFAAILGISVIVHVGAVSVGGLAIQAPQYAVKQAPSSVEIMFVEQPKEIEVVKVEEVKKVITTKEPVKKEVKQVEKVVPEKVEPKKEVEKVELEEKKVEPTAAQAPQKGARSEAKPDYLKNDPPVYPQLARSRGWEGVVLLDALVSREGRVKNITLTKSSGHRILDQAAMRAVKKWKFLPARLGNLSLESNVRIPVRFTLEEK